MNSFVVKSVFAAALVSAPLFAGPPEPTTVFPAPVSLMNFSPSFAGHPSDLSLLATRGAPTLPKTGVLTLKRSEDTPQRQPSTITHANAANFRFDARLPDSPIGLVAPQAGTIYFKPNNVWSFKAQRPN